MAEDEGVVSIEDSIQREEIVEPHAVSQVSERPIEKEDTPEVSIDKIAMKLLKYNFILTALEFHTELLESGKELPRLRDYFSNPGNFEKNLQTEDTSPILPRTSSIQTFDSLDFARYSDDGEKQMDERVAVLEFELRKAKETIKALRANLTFVTESEPNTPSGAVQVASPDIMKPYEKRALNFLVNEYLLHNNYKLSSITFSDENDDQDFEDWDDVGLNIPKPPNLLQLYRNYCHIHQKNEMCHKASEANFTEEPEKKVQSTCNCQEKFELETVDLKAQISNLNQVKEELLKASDQNYELDLRVKSLQRELNMLKTMDKKAVVPTVDANSSITNNFKNEETRKGPLTDNQSADQDFVMVNSFIPFDTLASAEKDDLAISNQRTDSNTRKSSNLSTALNDVFHCPRKVSKEFQKNMLSLCQSQKITQSNRLVTEVSEITNSKETVVMMLARCLPHIVPNILLAKREELIPLILCTVALHSDAKERDKLLNILFNLIKKPDEDQRHMILTGLVAIAQHLGSERVEAELLPQCWEQITHRYAERRLLVAESCGVLAPYIPSGIRSSLLLSMLQQMLQEDKDEIVREAVVRNLALLFVYVDDSDKFSKAVELWHTSVDDDCCSVVETGLNILLPSIAAWALEIEKLESHLLPTVMKALEDEITKLNQRLGPSTTVQEEQQAVLFIRASFILLHFLMLSVLQSAPFVENLEKRNYSPTEFDVDRLPVCTSVLHDLAVVLGDKDHLTSLIRAYDRYLSEEWYKPWDKYDWVVNNFLTWLLQILSIVRPQCQSIIHSLSELMNTFCHLFGRKFVQKKVKPPFMLLFKVTEEERISRTVSNVLPFSDASLPVYIAGVLTAFFQEEDRQEMIDFFQELFQVVSVCNVPICGLKATFIELSANKAYHELLLSILWDGVVHTSASVRVTAGRLFETLIGVVSENLLRTRVTPALVTLANDPEIAVRIATVPAFGAIIEICSQRDLLEKVHLQFQTFLDDPVYWDQYLLHVEVIRTFAKLGPNAEPKFRDEFILPRLAALAAQNNNTLNDTRKAEIGLALLDAYIAMSCCFMSDQLIAEAFLPGLRCLKLDLQAVAPDHEELINSTIQEFESKLDLNRSIERRTSSVSSTSPSSIEDMRNRVTKIFAARPAAPMPNIPNLFRRKT